MSKPIKIKLDVSKIIKEALFKGAKGTYLDCVAWPSKTTGQYGDTHYIVQELSREKRDAGEKGPIIGNMTVPDEEVHQASQTRHVKQGSVIDSTVDDSDIPF
jgi:hypothetical protein